MSSHWEEFFATHLPPSDFEDNRKLLKEFCERQNKLQNNIVLITSGGTTIPLEHNTVRFVDNFSAGTRGSSKNLYRSSLLNIQNLGSASAEYFLEHSYAVIFMHRQKSLEPFTRHFNGQQFFDMLELSDREIGPSSTISVKPDSVDVLAPILAKYKRAAEAKQILYINFTSVVDYMWLLRASCECLAAFEKRAVLYLAAAVSDFYIPSDKMPVHKIQSGEGAPTISLQLVPKILAPLVSLWVPNAFVVSFKLETDENLLIAKSRESLNKYKHKLVIANILQTRKNRVIFVTPTTSYEVVLTREQALSGLEIEEPIVADVVRKHDEFVSTIEHQ
ncbi:Phosphopantothenate--cysteine ligase [Pseudolycoriella hygida]|uniref:Phosphopantothenate--cysteine ligase n=1 Tax=Pseudolycoriella hygida TaxID=35572 RepID=A0A9Q0NGZ5_9DIPT|nr:Phosphopantothenate--cysteine ligase [Pseudolycoriella hygida]